MEDVDLRIGRSEGEPVWKKMKFQVSQEWSSLQLNDALWLGSVEVKERPRLDIGDGGGTLCFFFLLA